MLPTSGSRFAKRRRYASHAAGRGRGPGFNDDLATLTGLIYGVTAEGFSHRELRDYVEDIRSRLMHVPDIAGVELLGARDEKIFVEFSARQLAGLGIDRSALVSLRSPRRILSSPSGSLQTGNEKLLLRVSGVFESLRDILRLISLNGRLMRLRDIATVHRSYADPPQPMFRVNRRARHRTRNRHARGRRIEPRPQYRSGNAADSVADLPSVSSRLGGRSARRCRARLSASL